ncbi:MAG: hypothetical protein A2402_01875 [Candidatus Staskawiczbacteria bacterium RIFOXYC1_FULL_37_43]|uniref:HicB-like antitoxin of toxin-antitoxin system domain-containing protein n=1 Tax=Candidatus Nomurabacteria bacterium RIFOXYA1_FULL_35_17 TaxID=1801798 RepID=A0A1F6YHQ4_9BACT|nr:MAG: hypothetical protein A2192_01360 [Candidatus Nomurabacteria bacterium RIFOXYA1_FULL_35_17]OGZ63516.1 MAG: hypothetical protein A2813_00230 [Candidatus Staskawiczbacteria bacterium RIFCSPHIGHO2_01_FULL_37_17]OGZ71376.1 MAG: hypothetical protein A2891_02215 [Candidatus Staskawiczbacteria bacterium RIFCSPLOWO2_01_FULL_37_19]OGZ77012.1 MAG: hypothetical protein A2280_01765 [Candidatus Staskawiczbacteria bacterium RIFOXYA12_FULL_37_10]OGZ80769.1 MAG: hypothetical protein A2353_00825 [Candida
MTKTLLAKIKNKKFPIIVEKDEGGFYIVECPVFRGCYTQGKTIDEALRNIREVIALCLEEKENREILESYNPKEVGLHNITF